MKKKKSLQKLTANQKKIDKVLSLEQISNKDLESLNNKEEKELLRILSKRYIELCGKGEEWDKLLYKIEPITSEKTKNQLWEFNHSKITWAISTLTQEFGRIPSKTEISEKTMLSRQTVHKHLKDYSKHPEYADQIEQSRFLSSKLLARVYDYAIKGDMTAAKLYFNIIGMSDNNKSQKITNQNNYIQINGLVLDQEKLSQLNTEKLRKIEDFLKQAISIE